ncbi:MAG: alpha/beta fold hydrolase [Bauldia sp.]
MKALAISVGLAAALWASTAAAADYPAPKQSDFVLKNFKFHTGEVMPELKVHYATVGAPTGEPVIILHGTGGAGSGFLNAGFAGEMFGAGQPLDATKYFIILPDAIGSGQSAKPSDGLKTKFPQYDYDDMVEAQYRLVTEGLGIKHARVVMGSSQGGMHAWLWGGKYPDFMDALVPMASQPVQMGARNWMLRRLMVESIKNDPEYMGGNYTKQPTSLKYANVFFSTATSGGTLGYYGLAPTRALADKLVDDRLAAPVTTDANDFIYAWSSSGNYNPEPNLDKIKAAVLAINGADDERNPPETGATEKAMKKIKNARLLLIPASTETRGHGTTGNTALWRNEFSAFLASVPRQGM